MRWIVEHSLRFRFLLVFLVVALMATGANRLRQMPVDVFPEFAPPLVEIQTEALGLSTVEVEGLISVPLEQAFEGIDRIEILRSKSVPGLSSVVMIFERGTDIMVARRLVQERLTAVRSLLPNVARPPVILLPLSATSRTLKIGISSTDLSLIELSELVRWKIRPRLIRAEGVANIAVWGQRKRQLQVQVDPELLRLQRVTLDELLEATSDALDVGLLSYQSGARTGIGGFLDGSGKREPITFTLPVVNAEEFSNVSFTTSDGRALRLRDVAWVVEGHPPMIGDAIINDDLGILLIVEKFPWANTLEVTRTVEAALEAMKPGLDGVQIDSQIFRPATFIEMSIDNLTNALVIGAILVIAILSLFLYEWRVALISLAAIPVSLISAGLVLYLMNATVNTMVLAGMVIALGAVVDDAIIDIENIVRRMRENREKKLGQSMARIIVEASLEIRSSITYATLIIVLAVTPVFFMEGLSGAFFKPLALSYGLALLASMVVALTLTPALSYLFLSNLPLQRRESPIVPWMKRHYQARLGRLLISPKILLFATAGVFASGLLVLPLLGQELLPSFKERDFLMHWVTKPGTSHPEMNRITIAASKELRAIPGVRNFGAHVGRAVVADEVVGINFTENWVSVDPEAEYEETLARIQEVVNGYPGLYRDVLTYLKERIREVLSGASEAIVVRIYGPDFDILHDQAENVRDALKGIDGLVDLHVELQENIPHISVKVDLETARRYGIKPGDVRRAASTLMAGIEVSDIYRGSNLFDIVVMGRPDVRASFESFKNLLIDIPGGGHVRLHEVADVRIAPTPNVIRRESNSRRIDVAANVAGRDLGSVVADVRKALAATPFPTEYHPELVGEYSERESVESRLLGYSLAAVVGIFFLLQSSFASWRLAAVAFLALPAALVGGLLAAFAGGGVISLGSLVGFLTVLGVAARNGILLISHCQHLERHEGETFGIDLVLRGAQERLIPIMMTALTTGLALLPLIIFGDEPGHEIEYPMAVVILGGLVTSTLLNLFVIPWLYLQFGKPTVSDVSLKHLFSPG